MPSGERRRQVEMITDEAMMNYLVARACIAVGMMGVFGVANLLTYERAPFVTPTSLELHPLRYLLGSIVLFVVGVSIEVHRRTAQDTAVHSE